MKEERLFMREQRRFRDVAEAERILRKEEAIEDLDPVPILQEAVRAIVEKDPRSKQLSLLS